MRLRGCLLALVVPLLARSSDAAPFVAERDAQCVAMSADGKLAATGKSGQSNSEFPPRPHPSPRKCAAVELWDVATGAKLRRFESYGDIVDLRFSPDGKFLGYARLYASDDGVNLHEVILIDVPTATILRTYDRCHGFAFAPDGKSVLMLSRTRCIQYDLEDGSKDREIKTLGKSLFVTYAPDGRTLAVVQRGEDDAFRVRLCHERTGEPLGETVGINRPFFRVTFSPDGRQIATGLPGGLVALWDTRTFRLVAQLRGATNGHAHPFFSPDGKLLGCASQDTGDVVFWELPGGTELARYSHPSGSFRTFFLRRDDDPVRPELDPPRFVFTPDGESYLTGCSGGAIRSVSGGQEVRRFRD